MSEKDMNNMMNQLNQMFQKNEFPEEIQNLLNNFKNSSENNSETTNNSNTSNTEFDINTILKMKKIMDSMNSNKDDPRANLLLSLKPYLKESRRKKVDQYVQFFGLGKAFEIINSLGGDSDVSK